MNAGSPDNLNKNIYHIDDVVEVYVIDYIGSHCGMHYYDDSFLKILSGVRGVRAEVLSNYSRVGRKPFFRNFYKVPKLAGALFLLCGCLKLLLHVLRNRNAVYVVLSFGNFIDVGMIWITSLAKRSVVDVHEAIAQKDEGKRCSERVFGSLYRRRVENVIIHSERSDGMLTALGYRGNRFYVPHFRYGIAKDFQKENIGNDVAAAYGTDNTNFLFFGNIMYEKGIDLLLDAASVLYDKKDVGVRIVVAGKPTDDTLADYVADKGSILRIIARHINDDELVMLYSGADYIVLPYRKTSQSGIMEMAFHFRKPVIAARLPYFESVLEKYPSFGVLTDTDADSLSCTIANAGCNIRSGNEFFKTEDLYNYEYGAETETFIAEFGEFLLRKD